MEFKLFPIGKVRQVDNKTILEIFKDFKEGLDGLSVGKRILVFVWFDKSDTPDKRKILRVHPKGDINNPIRGVFSTRSPVRPNPIGIYNVKILKIGDSKLYVEEMDAFDETPIIDIKIFSEDLDCPKTKP
ncbi:tRNA (N6-threonylcarbamoyladenosine(37)-N6)-methyltransferase TrmO [Methanotorris formicicus]|uniref:Uncharacterized protein family UPF0066 n=1 Tax=Methanotorris formicicus Mc-S-70 TaxID=647171 RepID=H1KYI9_9EURY|nr:tRNA (N6-threonylcarbamoyladenosine(37)-N6)-methyltransferase TrmO [Methanotorris formicicus]EHP87029.1 Uncharacterized protein family UPF0066 [Methanotorris formicicus Mc-S-70]